MKRILALSGLLVVASNAMALTLLTSRAQITEQAYIDWGQLGPSFTVVNSPVVVQTSMDVFNVKVTGAGSTMERRNQGSGWSGNFASGDRLLWTRNQNGPMTLRAAKTLSDIGMQIQRDAFGAFSARITAYDGLDNSLGSFIVNGTSNSNANNSAIFIGVHSAASDILSVKVEMTDGQDFAVNRVSIEGCKVVPEPASMSALAIGVAGLIRRKMKNS